MTTALSATFQPGTTTDPARVLLQVTGAPSLTPPYVSDFATTVDGWTGPVGSSRTPNAPGPVPALTLASVPGNPTTFARTVTGLTVGATYEITLMAVKTNPIIASGSVAIGVAGIGATANMQPSSRAAITYAFTATATSHDIQTLLTGTGSGVGRYNIDTVKVRRTSSWFGTTITRSDANGVAIVREGLGGQDTDPSGAMTVTDYEAALYGTVNYTVVDGDGSLATATMTNPAAPGVWLVLPGTADAGQAIPPAFAPVQMVTNYREDSPTSGTVHQVIGRSDPIVNPGPLAARSGSFDLWCTDYATAAAVKGLLADGATAQLRQPDFPGLDLYFVAAAVSLGATEKTHPVQRWSASVTFTEVATPPTLDEATLVLDGGAP